MIDTNQRSEYDLLNFTHDSKIKSFTRDEGILFSDKITKVNRYGFNQERNIIITNLALYNLKKKDMKRRFLLSYIRGISISKSTDEFVVHCNETEYDYQYISSKRKCMIEIIAKYYYIETNAELKLFEGDMKSGGTFVTKKNEKKKDVMFSRMPRTGIISVSAYIYGTKEQKFISKKSATIKKTDKIFCNTNMSITDFKGIKTIGRGACGKVMLVEYKRTSRGYTIKSMRKDQIVSENITDNILLEKEILSSGQCPFGLTMSFFFHNPERVYFVTPFIQGGDLYNQLKQQGRGDEEKVRIYSAQIAIAIQHLHDYNYAYRDIKPENVLIDEDGYLKLCDFGAAVHGEGNKLEKSFAGSPEYASPEMINGEGHNTNTDWWSFGVLIYELLFGVTPFYHSNKSRMFELIQMGELKFPKNIKASNEVIDLIVKLGEKSPSNRLGRTGLDQIKTHSFFGTGNFDLLLNKKLIPPFKPVISDQKDTSNFEEEFCNMSTTESPVAEWVSDYQSWFDDFDKNEDEN